MIERNDYIVPHLNDTVRLNKPILFYWFIVLSYKSMGINEFGARFPSALCALLGILFVYFFARHIYNRTVGFLAGLILASAPQYLILSRLAIIDMSFAFFVTLALGTFWLGYSSTTRKMFFYYIAYFAASCAFLLKGPVGIILFIAPPTLYLILIKNTSELKKLLSWKFLLVFVLINIPWYYAAYARFGFDNSLDLLYRETIGRYMGGGIHVHKEPWYFFFLVIATGFAPWALYLPFALMTYIKKEHTAHKKFLIVWVSTVFVFFSLCSAKVATYVLPLYPILAIIMAYFWWDIFGNKQKRQHIALGIPAALLVISTVVSLFLLPSLLQKYPNYHIQLIFYNCSAIILSLAATLLYIIKKPRVLFLSVCAITCIIVLSLQHLVLPIIEKRRSAKPLAMKLAQKLDEKDTVISYGPKRYSTVFYTKHPIVLMHEANKLIEHLNTRKNCYLLIDIDHFKDLPKETRETLSLIDQYGDTLLVTNKKKPER